MERISKISVIIPAYNCDKTIQRCLDSLYRQSRLPDEVIIVDDCSSDNTVQSVKNYSVTVIKMPSRKYQSSARNAGAKKATGDILLFVDADIELKTNDLERALHTLQDKKVSAVVGVYDELSASEGLFGKYKNIHMAFNQMAAPEFIRWTNTSFLMVKRQAFISAGGFNEGLKESICEDLDFGVRLTRAGQKIFLNKDIKIIHHKDFTASEFIKTEYKRSKSITNIATGNFFSGIKVQWPVRLSFKMAFFILLLLYACLLALLLFKQRFPFIIIAILAAWLFLSTLPFMLFVKKKIGTAFSLAAFFILLLDINICLITEAVELPRTLIKQVINAPTKLL